MTRWTSGRSRRRGGVRAEAVPPPEAGAAEGFVLVEDHDGLLLLRSPLDDTLGPAEVAELSRALRPDEGTVTLIAGARGAAATGFWPRLSELLDSFRDAGTGSLRLVLAEAGTDRPDRPAVARRIADDWGLEVEAPDGSALVVPGGSLYVPVGPRGGGWWRFSPGEKPVPLGPRSPTPSWQAALGRVPSGTDSGCVVEQIPAGLLIRPAEAATPQPGDLYHAIPVDPRRPAVVVGVPYGEDVSAAEVAELLAALPESAASGVRLVPGGLRDLLPLGQSVAWMLGSEVEVTTGLPLFAADGPLDTYAARSVLVGPDGTPRWLPFVDAVVCLPSQDPENTPAPRLLRWSSPLPGPGRPEAGVVHLSDQWQVTVTRAGLWVGPRAAGPPPPARTVTTEGPVIELGVPGERLDRSLWPVLSRLLGGLSADLRGRATLHVHGTALDGGQELRRLAAHHGLRVIRYGPSPAIPGRGAGRRAENAAGPRPDAGPDTASAQGPSAGTPKATGPAPTPAVTPTPAPAPVRATRTAAPPTAAHGPGPGSAPDPRPGSSTPVSGSDSGSGSGSGRRPAVRTPVGSGSARGSGSSGFGLGSGGGSIGRAREALAIAAGLDTDTGSEPIPGVPPRSATPPEGSGTRPGPDAGSAAGSASDPVGATGTDDESHAWDESGPGPGPGLGARPAVVSTISVSGRGPVPGPRPDTETVLAGSEGTAPAPPAVSDDAEPTTVPASDVPTVGAANGSRPGGHDVAPGSTRSPGSPTTAPGSAAGSQAPAAGAEPAQTHGAGSTPVPGPATVTASGPPPVSVTASGSAPGIAPTSGGVPAPGPENGRLADPGSGGTHELSSAPHSRRTPAGTPPSTSRPLPATHLLSPVPITPGHRSTDTERAAFRALADTVWERHSAAVARALARMPALRGQEQEAARADLIALRLYLLTPEGPLSHGELTRALRAGEDRLLPYAACLASGLNRLPSYRGVALRGSGPPAPGSVGPPPGTPLRDAAPVSATPFDRARAATPVTPGAGYAVWSVTGRRVRHLLDAGAPDEVVFAPGTAFRVLDVRPGATPLVLLRELPTADALSTGLDDADRAVLARLDEALDGHSFPTGTGQWPERCAGPIGGGP
ncbi:hypothetical protein [Streptomyces sp. STR69]|uniref:hypothetical protein n=1 Tax=Streptomyces sp. STR69 TaxID=1796942 RepID=UPI0021C62D1F|nr:hypothetical protein [Streptomyces sp. STR69]